MVIFDDVMQAKYRAKNIIVLDQKFRISWIVVGNGIQPKGTNCDQKQTDPWFSVFQILE